MTKLLLALSAASLCALNVHAKQNGKATIEKMNAPRTAGKTTGIESRMKAYSAYSYNSGNLVLEDSAYLNYSPNFGWDHVTEQWKFDTAFGYWQNGASFEVGYRMTNTFDAQKRITEQLGEEFDGGNWLPTMKTLYSYNTFGTIATEEYQDNDNGIWVTDYKSINTHNAQGLLVENIYQSGNGSGTLGNQGRRILTYNGQGQQMSDTNYSWISGQWKESSRTSYYYTGALNSVMVSERTSGTTMTMIDSTINTFDSKGNLTEQVFKAYMNGSLSYQGKQVNTYDANNNLITTINMGFDNGTYLPYNQTTTTYNSFNQPLTETYKSWDGTAFVFEDGDGGENYYYEQFNNSVKDASVATGTMRVHPMPANNRLNLNLKWNDAQGATVVLFDMTGKVAGQWNTPAAAQHMQTLDISKIPAGTYMLKVMGTKGSLSQQVTIMR